MTKFKTGLIFILVLCQLLVMSVNVFAEFETEAKSAVLIEESTGKVVFEKNSEVAMPPASITKLMTLLVAFEAIESGRISWDDKVKVSEAAWRMGGSQMFLEIGQEVTVEDLITGISVISANDACVAIAEHIYGSESAFVRVMNRRAEEIGLVSSRFMNTTGLPAQGHRMSAMDIGVLSRYLIHNFPRIMEFESMTEFTFNGIPQYNRNPLLGAFPGADGLKTGWTTEAGYCLVGTAVQDDIRYISVVLNTKSEAERLQASRELLSYGFLNFEVMEVVAKEELLGEATVERGKNLSIQLKAEESIVTVVPIERIRDLEKVVVTNDEIIAPIEEGQILGTLNIELDGEILESVNLVAATEVSRANIFQRFFRFIKGLFTN